MGSFTSANKVPNEDKADEDVMYLTTSNWNELSQRCEVELNGWPSRIQRNFVDTGPHGSDRIRIMQWNILAQGEFQKTIKSW